VFEPGAISTLDIRSNTFDTEPVSPANQFVAAYAPFPHLSPWLVQGEREFVGREEFEGRDVLHYRGHATLNVEGAEEPPGTKYTFDSWVDAGSLEPARASVGIQFPDQEPGMPVEWTYRNARFIPESEIPADHFNGAALEEGQQTLDEAIADAAQLPFEAFWAGRNVPVEGEFPSGPVRSLRVIEVVTPSTPGHDTDTVFVRYAPDVTPTLHALGITSGPAATYAGPRPEDLQAARSGGAYEQVEGGYLYWLWGAAAGCTMADAVTDPDCRLNEDPTYGLVLERDGTLVHVTATFVSEDEFGKNVNPVNSREAILAIGEMLVPIEP
jgi:hypothetical protein